MSKISKRLGRANRAIKVWHREFLGDMSLLFLSKGEREVREDEVEFQKKHLKAYIKGHTRFTHGRESIGKDSLGREITQPKWHDVKQKLEQI